MGALVECDQTVAPGQTLTIDIVGVGPVIGTVRWAQAGKFGVQFTEHFDLARLAPKQQKSNDVTMLQPWYVGQGQRQASAGASEGLDRQRHHAVGAGLDLAAERSRGHQLPVAKNARSELRLMERRSSPASSFSRCRTRRPS